MQKTIKTPEELSCLDPAHAIYAHVQNVVSMLSEQITALPALHRIVNAVETAENEYMPSGPPMSPLTVSYFTCWAFFDLAIGLGKETLGTCILEVGRELRMDAEMLRIMKVMQDSRMGVYLHVGAANGRVLLREFVTEEEHSCIVPAGYDGRPGEIWLARVLPPPMPMLDYSVVFTTPYVILKPGEAAWRAYFDRNLMQGKAQPHDRLKAYEKHMKYGPKRNYWSEYIIEGYSNNIAEAIFLKGLPDVASSRPHSPEYVS